MHQTPVKTDKVIIYNFSGNIFKNVKLTFFLKIEGVCTDLWNDKIVFYKAKSISNYSIISWKYGSYFTCKHVLYIASWQSGVLLPFFLYLYNCVLGNERHIAYNKAGNVLLLVNTLNSSLPRCSKYGIKTYILNYTDRPDSLNSFQGTCKGNFLC